jgi:hypothetical protein
MRIRLGLPALLLIVAAILIFAFFPGEPTFEGKPLSYWLDQLPCTFLVNGGHARTSPFFYKTGAEAESDRKRVEDLALRALRAVRNLSTNDLHVLVSRLQSSDSRVKLTLQATAVRLGLMKRMPILSASMRQGQALTAIVELGDRAHPLVPELLELTKSQDTTARLAAFALRKIAPDEFRTHNLSGLIETKK